MIDPTRIEKVLEERIPASAFVVVAESPAQGTNEIEPTLDMIEAAIRKHLIDKLPMKQIQREVKNSSGLKMTRAQVRQILKAADKRKVASE